MGFGLLLCGFGPVGGGRIFLGGVGGGDRGSGRLLVVWKGGYHHVTY